MPSTRRLILGHVLTGVCTKMNRRKPVPVDVMETPLKRCLSTLDITLLGVGHMVGAGIYVLTGTVAKDMAGPGIILSFILAGFVSMLAALCYAEFGSRVPKAGSAYVYTYISIGEFWAFVIGWNILLEHMLGAASVARAWSGYVDSLLGGWINNATVQLTSQLNVHYLPHQPDLLACVLCLLYALALGIGVKATAVFNGILTIVNICVMLLVICVGFWYADTKNWSEDEGGFLPYGFVGVIAGAATCFYAFVGFDSIATSGEEAKNPATSIPIATILSLCAVTAGYILVSAALTLMIPIREINPTASLPEAFGQMNITWAKYIISIGALCGMTTTLLGSLFSLPRCMYAMAADGLLFSCFGSVNSTTQVPFLNLAVAGISSAVLALLFDLKKLVEFMSIGTLLAYTIVSASVIILRYHSIREPISISNPFYRTNSIDEEDDDYEEEIEGDAKSEDDRGDSLDDVINEGDNISQLSMDSASPESDIFAYALTGRLRPKFQWLEPMFGNLAPGRAVSGAVLIFTITCFIICFQLESTFTDLYSSSWHALILHGFSIFIALACVAVIAVHQQNTRGLSFKVPFVPYVPALSIFCNVVLMVHLSALTWLRFFVWVCLGMIVYFLYGIHHSKEGEACSSYSMLMTSTEATKSNWGATGSGFQAVFGRSMAGAGVLSVRKSVFDHLLGRKVEIRSSIVKDQDNETDDVGQS